MNQFLNEEFDWQRCPEVGRLIARHVDHVVGDIPFASRLRQRMLDATGTRLIDWVDHLCLPVTDSLSRMVEEMGYVRAARDVDEEVWRHPAALVPAIRIREQATADVCLKVDSVTDFLQVHQLDDVTVMGHLDSIVKSVIVAQAGNCRLAVIERHGTSGFQAEAASKATRKSLVEHAVAFLNRERIFSDGDSVFNEVAGFETQRWMTWVLTARAICSLSQNGVIGKVVIRQQECRRSDRTNLGLAGRIMITTPIAAVVRSFPG